MRNIILKLNILAFIFLLSTVVTAESETTEENVTSTERQYLLYVGAGSADDSNSYENDDTPFSVGFLMHQENSNKSWGVDIAGEGTALDSTYGRNNSVAQGLSYNFLYATNLSSNSDRRFDLGVIVGAREKSNDCPDSYLGYQCYADESPDVEYGFNFGAMLHVTFQTFTIGLRATGESTQLIIGFNF